MRLQHFCRLCISLFLGFGTVAWAQPPVHGAAAPFLEKDAWFQSSYDDFIAKIRSRNSVFNIKALLLPFIFPRGPYETAQKQLDCYSVSYASDGLAIQGWMLSPKHSKGKKLPVVIFNRGGNGSFGALKFVDLFSHAIPIAERGFVVLASQYRGVDEENPKTSGVDEYGGSDVRDVQRLIAMVKDIPNADPDNIFVLGFSRGVMESYLATRNNNGIRAMAMINGVVDLQSELAFRPEMEQVYRERIPGYRAHKAQQLLDRSAIAWAGELPRNAPILLLHGSKDDRVATSNGPRMKQRLDALHHPNKLVIYQGDGHFLDKERVVTDVVAWFKANLHAAAVGAAR